MDKFLRRNSKSALLRHESVFFAAFLILLLLARGSQAAPANESLSWQRIELEHQLQAELANAIDPVIPKSHFVLQVVVGLTPPKPKTVKRLRILREEEISKDKVDEGSLLLSKVGVWAEPPTSEPSEEEQAATRDIFENISSVAATFTIDSTVPDEKISVAKKIISTRLGSYSKQSKVNAVKATVFSPLPTPTPEPKADSSKDAKDSKKDVKDEKSAAPPKPVPTPVWGPKEWASEFKLPAALLICSLLFIVVLFMNSSRSLRVEREKILAMNAEKEKSSEAPAAHAAAEMPSANPAGNAHHEVSVATATDGENSDYGVLRMKALVQENPGAVSMMVKQWINSSPQGSIAALAILARSLTVDELSKTCSMLSEYERKEWKKLLNQTLSPADLAQAQTFLSNQVSEGVLVPDSIMEVEAREFFASLNPQECVELAGKNPESGAALLNILSTTQVAKMISLMPKDVMDKVLNSGSKWNASLVRPTFDNCKPVVEAMRERRSGKLTPFIEKSIELIREVEPEKESPIFAAMARAEAFDALSSVSKSFPPSALLDRLAPAALNGLLVKIPTSLRAEIIYTRSEESKLLYLTAIGESGKMRELIDIELSEIDSDASRKAQVNARSGQTWKRFVEIYREQAKRDLLFQAQLEPLRANWLSEITNGKIANDGGQANAA